MRALGRLSPPEGWRRREDAGEFEHAVTRLAYAEAQVLRVEEKLRIGAPALDCWEDLYDWNDEAYQLLAELGAAREARDYMLREVETILIRWHDEDRRAA